MTLQELQKQYDMHNVAEPHKEENCEICKRYKARFDNPLQDLNGNNF